MIDDLEADVVTLALAYDIDSRRVHAFGDTPTPTDDDVQDRVPVGAGASASG